MWTRRHLLQMGAASAALAAIPGGVRAAPVAGAGPHSVVVLFLRGGVDGVYAFDPKTRSEVAPKVDVPYGPVGITEAGGLRMGPHWNLLSRHAERLAVVHGIQVKTANHESGAEQMLRLKTGVSTRVPGILDIIGSQRGDRPLASVTMGEVSSLEFAPAAFGGPTTTSKHTVLDLLDDVSPDDYALLSRVYAQHLEDTHSWAPSTRRDRTREHLAQVQALFARMPEVPPFEPEKWTSSASTQPIARDLQRTLWLLENDLTRCVYLKVYLNWDSHYDNAGKQRVSSGRFVSLFSRFLDELTTRTGPRGVLADHTLLVAGSELGRFPVLNGVQGKDHFPETSLLFSGPGIRTNGRGATYGQTGKMMEGLPVSLATGAPHDTGTHLILDDVGTTLLHMTGFTPDRFGYRGRRMAFLENA